MKTRSQRFQSEVPVNRPEERGTFVNPHGMISYGVRAAGEVPATADLVEIEKADRYGAALASYNSIRTEIVSDLSALWVAETVKEVMGLAT